jgi:hypothetical protein
MTRRIAILSLLSVLGCGAAELAGSPGSGVSPGRPGERYSRFNVATASLLHKGLTNDQIEYLFGPPDRVEMDSCGPEGKKFPCMIYKYEMGKSGRFEGITNYNAFYFSHPFKNALRTAWVLYLWPLDRVHPSGPAPELSCHS